MKFFLLLETPIPFDKGFFANCVFRTIFEQSESRLFDKKFSEDTAFLLIGIFMACWIILYEISQALTPKIISKYHLLIYLVIPAVRETQLI